MTDRPANESTSSGPSPLGILLGLLCLLGLAFAFGLLDLNAPAGPGTSASLSFQMEYWFFDPSGSSPGLVAIVCAWLVWHRSPLFLTAEQNPNPKLLVRSPARIAAATALGAATFGTLAWAELNAAPDLRFLSLAFFLAAAATWMRGRSGLRQMVTPCVLLLLALPIPFPLRSEVLWWLQNFSAAGSAHLLGAFGLDVSRSGAHLLYGDLAFLVIEGCSGLRSLLTLIIVSVVLRELLELRGRSGWLLLAAAPPLALALNVIRISIIMLGAEPGDPGLESEHVEQGLAVLFAGTLLLFGMGHLLAPPPSPDSARPSFLSVFRPDETRLLAISIAVLCGLRWLTTPWPPPASGGFQTAIPESAAGWKSAAVELDYPFLGVLPREKIETRVYQRLRPLDRLGHRPIDVLISQEALQRPRESPLSSKLVVPGREWELVSTETVEHYTLGRSIELSEVQSRQGRSLIYSWTVGDRGLWADSLRSLIAAERGPFARTRPRMMVTLAADLGTEPEAREHARKMLDRFIHDFREPLRALGSASADPTPR